MPPVERRAPMRVCVFTTAHPWDDVRVHTKFASSWLESGDSVTWVGPDIGAFSSDAERDPRLRYVPLSFKPGLRGRIQGLVHARQRLADSGSYDWIYCPDPDAAAIALSLRGRRGRVLFDIHEEFHQNPRIAALPSSVRSIARRAVKSTMVSIAARAQLVTSVNRPILDQYCHPDSPQMIIVNAPPADFARSEAHGKPAGTGVRFFHGKASAGNGTPVILRALELMRLNDLAATLMLFPWTDTNKQGLYDATIFDTMDQLGITAHVEVAAPVAHAEMPEIMSRADVGLIGYGRALGQTSLPNRFFEYMAVGLPVIVPSYSPLMTEIVSRHNIGITADFEDARSVSEAMTWMLQNGREAREMGKRGRALFLKSYSWQSTFKELRTVMDTVAD